jgi:type IV secretion system protein VirB9
MNSILLLVPVSLAVTAATKPTEPAPIVAASPVPSPVSKTVLYSEQEIVPVQTRLRFTTMVQLPKGEQILDFVCGDKDFWVISGTQNFAFVKPAKEGARTNLNLITASGNVYSFTLSEVGDHGIADLKIFVQPRDESLLGAINGAPRFVPATAVDDYRQQAELARKAADDAAARVADAERRANAAKDRAVSEYPGTVRTDYKWRRDSLFDVKAIYRDEKFTYIKASPSETPAVYEMKDGKPSLINFHFANGLYTLDKVVTDGYLAVGKKKLVFTEEEPGK